MHDKYLRRRLSTVAFDDPGDQPLPPPPPLLPKCPLLVFPRELKMSQQPTKYGVSLDIIKASYGASSFNTALARYIIHLKHPEFSQRQVRNAAEDFHIPFHKVSVFHHIKFISHDPFSSNPSADIVVDSIHSEPPGLDNYGKVIPARFDTAIIKRKMEGVAGIKGKIFYIKLCQQSIDAFLRLLCGTNLLYFFITICWG